MKEVFIGCWKYYRYFVKEVRELKEFVDVMEVNVGKFIKVDGIRWVLYFL